MLLCFFDYVFNLFLKDLGVVSSTVNIEIAIFPLYHMTMLVSDLIYLLRISLYVTCVI